MELYLAALRVETLKELATMTASEKRNFHATLEARLAKEGPGMMALFLQTMIYITENENNIRGAQGTWQ